MTDHCILSLSLVNDFIIFCHPLHVHYGVLHVGCVLWPGHYLDPWTSWPPSPDNIVGT